MDTNEANEKRLIASEIILQLWESGEVVQLEILQAQIDASVRAIKAEAVQS